MNITVASPHSTVATPPRPRMLHDRDLIGFWLNPENDLADVPESLLPQSIRAARRNRLCALFAAQGNLYRDAVEADLTQGIPVAPESYSGIVSSGTFTTGHVGPDAIDALLRVARHGAQFAISINSKHFETAGFDVKFRALELNRIQKLTFAETPIYGDLATGNHKCDVAKIALFEKT